MINIKTNEYANAFEVIVLANNREIKSKLFELEEDKNDYIKWLVSFYNCLDIKNEVL